MNFFKKIIETTKTLRKKGGMRKTLEHSASLEHSGGYTDAIVILTGELTKVMVSGKDKIKTSPIAHIRGTAGALLYKEMKKSGKNPVIIVSGGDVYGDPTTNTVLSDIMAKEIQNKYNIPKSNIVLERQSIDTSQNAKYSRELLKALKITPESTTIVTNAFHSKRSTRLFNKYFGKVNTVSAEKILTEHTRSKGRNHYDRLIKKRLASNEQKRLARKDKIISFISHLPFGEKFIERLATFNRQGGRKVPSKK